MDHLRRPKSNSLENLIFDAQTVLQAYIKQHSHLIVGLSGGVDSIALLDILAALAKQMSFTLSAVHVNHGISNNAAAWSQFCCDLCYAYGIPITVSYLTIKKERGTSLEAVAREKRYEVFNHLRADYLVLAQHQDDQAETLLLQLLRGAGVKGLSAMPVIRKQPADRAPSILRPLLEVSRRQIEIYAHQRQLDWIHDESNDNITYNRNFLRHKILPAISKRYPNYAGTLQRTSRHMAEASQLLDELAEIDAQHAVISGNLRIAAVRKLNRPRAKNLLRYILQQRNVKFPSAAKLEDILNQFFNASMDAQLHIVFGDTELRCYKGSVYILPKRKLSVNRKLFKWQGEACLILKALGGSIQFTHERGRGLSREKILQALVTIRTRQGGEHYQPSCNRPRRSLKKLFQEAGIPPWERYTLPLLYCGEKLAWVPGIGADCEFQARSNEIGIVPEWRFE